MSKFVGLIVDEAQDNADAPKKERKKKTGAKKNASQLNTAETVDTAPVKTEVDPDEINGDLNTETDKVEVTDNENEAQDNADAPKRERK